MCISRFFFFSLSFAVFKNGFLETGDEMGVCSSCVGGESFGITQWIALHDVDIVHSVYTLYRRHSIVQIATYLPVHKF